MTATTTTPLSEALHAYRSALAILGPALSSEYDAVVESAWSGLRAACLDLEAAMPSDRDLCFVLDDNCELWALEWGNHRRTGEGWPDSSFPTVTKVEDLICN